MDILTGQRVNEQLANELRQARIVIARLEEAVRLQAQQIHALNDERERMRRTFDALKDSHATLQQDFLAAGRLLDRNAYVNELHELALAEQARANEWRRPH